RRSRQAAARHDIEPRRVKRAFDDVSLQIAAGEQSKSVRADIVRRVAAAADAENADRLAVERHAERLTLFEVCELADPVPSRHRAILTIASRRVGCAGALAI